MALFQSVSKVSVKVWTISSCVRIMPSSRFLSILCVEKLIDPTYAFLSSATSIFACIYGEVIVFTCTPALASWVSAGLLASSWESVGTSRRTFSDCAFCESNWTRFVSTMSSVSASMVWVALLRMVVRAARELSGLSMMKVPGGGVKDFLFQSAIKMLRISVTSEGLVSRMSYSRFLENAEAVRF